MSNKNKLSDPVFYRDWHELVIRNWAAELTGNELSVVFFVLDRTLGWGKEWEVITYPQLTDGVKSRDGKIICRGLKMGAATARRVMVSLVEKGVILREEICGGYKYSLNYEWDMKEPKNKKQVNKGLATPKGSKKQDKNPEYEQDYTDQNDQTPLIKMSRGVIKMSRQADQNDHQIYINKINKEKINKEDGREENFSTNHKEENQSPIDKLESISSSIKNDLSARREKKKSVRRFSMKNLERVWRDGCVSHFEECGEKAPSYSRKHFLGFYQKCKSYKTQVGSCPLPMIEWCLSMWRVIADCELAWMQNPPLNPSVSIMLQQFHIFEQAWNDKKQIEKVNSMSYAERQKYILQKRGFTEEQANEKFSREDEASRELEKAKRIASKAVSSPKAYTHPQINQKRLTEAARRKKHAIKAKDAPKHFPDWDEE